MSSAQDRVIIANTRLAIYGEFQSNEPPEVTQRREHYRTMLRDAMAEIAEAQNARMPYKDDDD